ncbi:anthranilate synthase component II [Corynebacterium caspium]|uniref:anthranilate synthase component II n=1 Tax=Corynebacterium caspium TaxID=234828 RepID=UPI0003802D01|nr:anthranilate synthase component II [Corynebacterium caspium]WKD60043.1 Anthranilate synthase component 2 [Corynebacterium caspium DSM 44850]
MKITLIDNRDSFVYNLVDAVSTSGHECTVYRNTVPTAQVLASKPDVMLLSPGPGHPLEAGTMMETLAACLAAEIPVFGVCLGFQALLEHFAGSVKPCGAMHGVKGRMELTAAGLESGLFDGLTIDADIAAGDPGRIVPIARYHSLGCTNPPAELTVLGWSDSEAGPVVQAACLEDADSKRLQAIGVQFHPESLLTPAGPIILQRILEKLHVSRETSH